MPFKIKQNTALLKDPSRDAEILLPLDEGTQLESADEKKTVAGEDWQKVKFTPPAGKAVLGWVLAARCEEIAVLLRPALEVSGFVRSCMLLEREFNLLAMTSPFFVSADFVIARALIETGADVGGERVPTNAGEIILGCVGPLQVSADEWTAFLNGGKEFAQDFHKDDSASDRNDPQVQTLAAFFRMFADAQAVSLLKPPKDADPKDKPFMPTYQDLFHAYLLNNPKAAVAVLDAKNDNAGKDKSMAELLGGVLDKAPVDALFATRAKYLGTPTASKSVSQFFEATFTELKKALEEALKLIQKHAKEEIPKPPAAPNVIVVPVDLGSVASLPGNDPVPFAAFASTVNELFWPVITPHPEVLVVSYQNTSGKIVGKPSRHFFADRSKGNRHHVGVDIYCNEGDDVVACADGTVVRYYPFYKTKTGEQSYALFVEHAGVVINYGEVKAGAPVSEGKTVKAGEKIGVVSSTDMIHFETYVPGTTENSRWLKGGQRPPKLLNPTKLLLGLAANATRILPNGTKVAGSGKSAQIAAEDGTTPISLDKDDHLTLARTMYGEARSAKEPSSGREAVAHVVMNRVARKHMGDDTISKVCLRSKQFSCWNPGDPNLKVIKDALPGLDPMFQECLDIAEQVIKGQLADNTGGALHYYSETIAAPDWAKSPAKQSAKIGSHLFFINVK